MRLVEVVEAVGGFVVTWAVATLLQLGSCNECRAATPERSPAARTSR
jgi:hypothetical protein